MGNRYYTQPLEQRFWSKVNKHGPRQPHMKTRCWEWTGAKNEDGYGLFKENGVVLKAHRFSYEFHKKLLGKLSCCHHCDNPSCVRPSHLFSGTRKQNSEDMCRKGRQSRILGEKNPSSKISNSQVCEIIHLYNSGNYYQKELGEMFALTQGHISKILNHHNRCIGEIQR